SPRLRAVRVVRGCEVPHLAGDLRFVARGVKGSDAADAGTPFDEPRPRIARVMSKRRDHAHPGYDNTRAYRVLVRGHRMVRVYITRLLCPCVRGGGGRRFRP